MRHLKTVGPIPLLWDRWKLGNPFAPRLRLHELLEACDPATELMLDLKGPRPGIGARVARELARYRGRRRVSVCSRNWRALEALAGEPGLACIYSIGSARQLRAFLRLGERVDGVSIHASLLDAGVVAALRERTGRILAWAVHTPEHARALSGWGVDGLITERLDLAAALRA